MPLAFDRLELQWGLGFRNSQGDLTESTIRLSYHDCWVISMEALICESISNDPKLCFCRAKWFQCFFGRATKTSFVMADPYLQFETLQLHRRLLKCDSCSSTRFCRNHDGKQQMLLLLRFSLTYSLQPHANPMSLASRVGRLETRAPAVQGSQASAEGSLRDVGVPVGTGRTKFDPSITCGPSFNAQLEMGSFDSGCMASQTVCSAENRCVTKPFGPAASHKPST